MFLVNNFDGLAADCENAPCSTDVVPGQRCKISYVVPKKTAFLEVPEQVGTDLMCCGEMSVTDEPAVPV